MKFIYLDEFVWIDLRRYIFKEKDYKDLSSIYSLMCKQVKNGEWVFPISFEHIQETRNTGNDTKRMSLSLVQEAFSNGYTIRNAILLKDFEIDMMISNKKSWCNPTDVITKETHNIFGTSKQQIFSDYMNEQGITEDDEMYRRVYDSFTLLQSNRKRIVEMTSEFNMRTEEDEKFHVDILENTWMLHCEKPFSEISFLKWALSEYYQNEPDKLTKITLFLDKKPQTEILDAFRKMPTFYCNAILLYRLIKSHVSSTAFHKNDFTDALFLSTAIPYCDVVITEARWKDYAKQGRLCEIYDTEILTKLSELEAIS